MAVEMAQLLWKTFLSSLEKIGPKLPDRLSNEFLQIKDCIRDDVWSSLSATESTDLLQYLYNLNDALADCRVFVEQSKDLTQSCSLFNPIQLILFVAKMKQRLEPMKEGISKLVERPKNSTSAGITTIFPTGRHNSFEPNPGQVIEYGEQETQIKALLADKGYKAIGVYGTSGSGKTALLRKVLNSPPFGNKEFSPVIWVSLARVYPPSVDYTEAEIVNQILRKLEGEVNMRTITNSGLTVRLDNIKRLLASQKYLIVVDDVSTIIVNQLMDSLPRDSGGKIIITSSLKEVVQELVGEENLIYVKPTNSRMEPDVGFLQPNWTPVVGFDEQEKQIEALLWDNAYNAVAVCGMGGSGKTTLIQKVLNSQSFFHVFSPIIWVCLSDINSRDDEEIESIIVKYILCELGNDVDRWATLNPSKTELLKILKDSLMSKKYLIVFDDVSEKRDFYANLGHLLPETDAVGDRLSDALPRDGGGKIIVTSRLREVAESMVGQKNLIHMKPLNRESCRLILEDWTAFHYAREIESLLNDNGSVAIGIYGPSSALIHKALRSPNVLGKFERTVWVCEPQLPDGKEDELGSYILNRLLEELEYDVDALTIAHNYYELEFWERVTRSLLSKKYLIVLADLGSKNPWFGETHSDDYYNKQWILFFNALRRKGDGTVIVTSGAEEVVREMVDENNLIHVTLPELADGIVDQCGHGLPLAAKTLANIIRDKALQKLLDRAE